MRRWTANDGFCTRKLALCVAAVALTFRNILVFSKTLTPLLSGEKIERTVWHFWPPYRQQHFDRIRSWSFCLCSAMLAWSLRTFENFPTNIRGDKRLNERPNLVCGARLSLLRKGRVYFA